MILGGCALGGIAGVFLLPRLLVLIVSLIGFEVGGGGSVHLPPKSISRGSPAPLELELSAVSKHGPMDQRMTKITCHYRLAGSPAYVALPMLATNVDERHLIARAVLPSFDKDAEGPIEYYFDFYFNGQYNKRDPVKVPLK